MTEQQIPTEQELRTRAGVKSAEIPKRRVKMLMVKPADFMVLFTKGVKWRKNTHLIKGVPEDAKLVTIAADSARNGIMLVVESSEYDPIPINILPPVEPVEIDIGVRNATKKKVVKRKKRPSKSKKR